MHTQQQIVASYLIHLGTGHRSSIALFAYMHDIALNETLKAKYLTAAKRKAGKKLKRIINQCN